MRQAAAGILRVNSNSASLLIRQRTIEQGLDPRDFALYAFGGAGPLHAYAFADELDINEVVIPLGNGASTLSAYGISACDAMEVFEEDCILRAPFDPQQLTEVVERLEEHALSEMAAAGFSREHVRLSRSGQARYAEQYMQELNLPMPEGPIDDTFAEQLSETFASEYSRLYSAAALSSMQTVEVFTVRVTASVSFEAPAAAAPTTGATSPSGHRDVYWPDQQDWVKTDIYAGAPAPGVKILGPALIQLPHTTIAVGTGQALTTDDNANCVLHLNTQESY